MIVNSNVNASNLLMVRAATGTNSNDTAGTDAGSLNFADVLQSSQKEIQPVTTKTDVSNALETKSQNTDSSQLDKPNAAIKDTQAERTTDNSQSVEKKTDTTNPAPATKEEDTVTEEEMETISGVVVDVLKMIMNQLHLSLDDVKNTLDAMGMDLKDLLSFRGIKDFFLQASQLDTSDLLTDGDAQHMYQNFMQQWSQIFEDASTSVQEISNLLENHSLDIALQETGNEEYLEQDMINVLSKTQDTFEENVDRTIKQEPEVIVVQEGAQATERQQNMQENHSNMQNAEAEDTPDAWGKETAESVIKNSDELMNPVLQNIQDAIQNVEAFEQPEGVTESRQIVEQVIEQVKVHMNQDTTSMQLQLYPEHLGRIQIHVVSKDGVMTARIAAETEQARQAIENGLASLKETFEQQDLKVDAVEVMVSTAGFERGRDEQNTPEQDKTSRRTGKLVFSDIEDDAEAEEAAEQERMLASGSSVSYTA